MGLIVHALRDTKEQIATSTSTNARQPTLACTVLSAVISPTTTSACVRLAGLGGTAPMMYPNARQHRARTALHAPTQLTLINALASPGLR